MELRTYIRVLLKGWWLILPTVLISVSSALVFTYSQTPIYRTRATFVVSPGSAFGSFNDVIRGLDSLSKREGVMSTYVEIATSSSILSAVYKEMGLGKEQLEYLSVSSALIPSTNIVEITVESDDPLIAKTCADTVGRKTIEYVKNLYEIYDMKPLDPAYIPRVPAKPKRTQNLMVAALLGSLVGGGSAFLLNYLRSPRGRIASVSFIDSDTGVYNQHYFLQRLGEELSRAKRHGRSLSLALMNIEYLDVIQDIRLPRQRNEALRQVALFLKHHLREEDVVARFEGDTFALLFPDTSGPDAEQILRKLQTRMDWSIFELDEGRMKLNLSAVSGVVAYDLNGAGREELVVRAKKTLQRARDNGYGKVYLYKSSEEMGTRQNESAIDE